MPSPTLYTLVRDWLEADKQLRKYYFVRSVQTISLIMCACTVAHAGIFIMFIENDFVQRRGSAKYKLSASDPKFFDKLKSYLTTEAHEPAREQNERRRRKDRKRRKRS